MEFSKQEYWSGLPFPSPEALSNPWIEAWSPALQADSLPSEPPRKPLLLQTTALSLRVHPAYTSKSILGKWDHFPNNGETFPSFQ